MKGSNDPVPGSCLIVRLHRGLSAAVFSVALLNACAAATAPAAEPSSTAPPADVSERDARADCAAQGACDGTPAVHVAEDPAEIQRKALESCQQAAELHDADDVDGAIAAIDVAYSLMLQLPSLRAEQGDDLQAKQDIRMLLASLIKRVYAVDSGKQTTVESRGIAASDLGLPVVDNEHVQREIKSFTTREKKHFFAGYQRSGRYRPMILKKLEEAGLPSQLSWLPLVESSFIVAALSRASALGLWQFISSTGLRYGLERDSHVDERLDPEKATDAAIAYLSDLHRLFGDWPKALAAYNCGEGRVQRLQQRHADRFMDFWDLFNLLPDETRRYVPRLIAVLQLIENPEKYGITLPELDAPMSPTDSIEMSKAVELKSLEVALGIDAGTIASLNPELRQSATPKRSYTLRLPPGAQEGADEAIAALAEYAPPKPKYLVHRVRSGETLSSIAERYRTSVSSIMRWNQIRSAHRIWPGQRLRIPVRG